MKQLAILIMCFLVSCIMPAQTQKNVLPVQEKVYLHIDNNCYFLGDTIWYKAYVVLADDNSPEPLTTTDRPTDVLQSTTACLPDITKCVHIQSG